MTGLVMESEDILHSNLLEDESTCENVPIRSLRAIKISSSPQNDVLESSISMDISAAHPLDDVSSSPGQFRLLKAIESCSSPQSHGIASSKSNDSPSGNPLENASNDNNFSHSLRVAETPIASQNESIESYPQQFNNGDTDGKTEPDTALNEIEVQRNTSVSTDKFKYSNSPSINNTELGEDTLHEEPGGEENVDIIIQPNDKSFTEDESKFPLHFQNAREIATFTHNLDYHSYFVGCKWSPDGTCLLTNCADYTFRLFDVPKEVHGKTKWDTSGDPPSQLIPSLKVTECGLIYDFAWYPFMSSWDAISCCFICTSAGSPLHLWDAYTGSIRATYKAYDYADEVHSALCVAFSINGADIYCGFRNLVKIFDLSKPGRDCDVFKVKDIGYQKGIVSCIAENPALPEMFAVGNYTKTIGLYTRSREFVCMLTGQKSGLTKLQFSEDGVCLFSGARVDNEIICWDLRNPGKVLYTMNRVVATNQRIHFELTQDTKHLISGGTDGWVRLWNIPEQLNFSDECTLDKTLKFKAHSDCVNGVSFNKQYSLLATSSGQHHYPELVADDDSADMFSDNLTDKAENSVKMWWVGPMS